MPVGNIVIAILREVINESERGVQSNEIVKMDELLSSPRKVFLSMMYVCIIQLHNTHTHTQTHVCVHTHAYRINVEIYVELFNFTSLQSHL